MFEFIKALREMGLEAPPQAIVAVFNSIDKGKCTPRSDSSPAVVRRQSTEVACPTAIESPCRQIATDPSSTMSWIGYYGIR